MRKMKIGGIVLGDKVSLTQEVLKNEELNLSDSRKTDLPLSEELIEECRESFVSALPSGSDSFFCSGLCKESDIIDLDDADVYVVFPFGGMTDLLFAALFGKNRPILVVTEPYEKYWSYGAVYYPYFMRDTREIAAYLEIPQKVCLVRSQDELKEELAAYLVQFCVRNTTLLCIGEPMYEPFHSWNWGYAMIRLAQEKFGMKCKTISSDKFLEIFKNTKIDYEKGTIFKEAKKCYVAEDKDLTNVEKLFYIFKDLIKEYQADAFTVNCLYSMIHTGLKATACYSLSKLNDLGIPAACEADITTLVNMVITTYASKSPVFMLNPYLFPEDNKLFVSHCSSPTIHAHGEQKRDEIRLYDYYEIEDLPCGLQVLHETGPVTITGISHNDLSRMVVISGNVVRNTAFSSCRTQMEIEIDGDIKELAEQYQGRHWALVYGNHKREIIKANDLLGIRSISI